MIKYFPIFPLTQRKAVLLRSIYEMTNAHLESVLFLGALVRNAEDRNFPGM
ncbi:hypothetical protein BROSI_A0859 [Candidatus Brocadia sinica JPN1]|uniref:Uncharacterized protein n=1 Tax=Candidatus Brocadia sinica JPN1 TaxID=1197129 RepID=A0ABQ0JUF5_9BACT|nr:hypothetical protein BROSI_A0859 [Candidatus Brocadia sinica JPN1]